MENAKFGTGLIPDPEDKRDYVYKPLGGDLGVIMTNEEWENGYDIEKELGIKIKPKNQYSSSSCVGQGSSSLSAVLDFIETKTWDEHSAKAIYSQIALANGGAYLRGAMKLLKEWGELYEKQLKSYKENGETDEDFMRDLSWKTPEMNKLAKTLQAKDYKRITGFDIDTFAKAIKDGKGVLMGVTGTNNGTWKSVYPIPPTLTTPYSELWGHALYAGKFKIENGKKYIGVLNSWGNIGDEGWQWLGEEWFGDGGRWIINPWVLIDKPNNNNENMTFKKLKNENDIYACNEESKLKCLITDMPTLNVMYELTGIYNFMEVENLDDYKKCSLESLLGVDRKIN